jgi:hypothetical protein
MSILFTSNNPQLRAPSGFTAPILASSRYPNRFPSWKLGSPSVRLSTSVEMLFSQSIALNCTGILDTGLLLAELPPEKQILKDVTEARSQLAILESSAII